MDIWIFLVLVLAIMKNAILNIHVQEMAHDFDKKKL